MVMDDDNNYNVWICFCYRYTIIQICFCECSRVHYIYIERIVCERTACAVWLLLLLLVSSLAK